jgi:hypothetical protein
MIQNKSTQFMTHKIAGKLSGTIQPYTEENIKRIVDFHKLRDRHYGRVANTKIEIIKL